MTVHGEREVIPALSEADAGTALQQFINGYNKANRTLDPKVNATYETGALHAIDEAVIKVQKKNYPQGLPNFRDLELHDARYTIPKQAGWPKFFVADAVSNRKDRTGNFTHWYLAFTRNGVQEKWKAAYLSVLTDDEAPRFTTDADGHAEAVPLGSDSGLQVDPGKLGQEYADYLKTGKGDTFAPGQQTDHWRQERAAAAKQPGQHIQTVDQPSRWPAMALRTEDGGALVFFATNYYQHKQVSPGRSVPITPAVEAVMDGPAEKSEKMTTTTVSGQAVKVPAEGAAGQVVFLNRIESMTSAQAE